MAIPGQGGMPTGSIGVITVAIVLVGALAFVGGFYWGQGSVQGDSGRGKAAAQNFLVNLLHKLADVSEEKAPKVADATVSGALDVLGDVFQNTSIRTSQSLQSGDTYLCGGFRWLNNFTDARLGTNYSLVCGTFQAVVTASAGSLPDFETAFNDLIWTLIGIDNTIALDP